MLISPSLSVRLPQSRLVYTAFRLAMQESLSVLELSQGEESIDTDKFPGFLSEVPFLAEVALPVQIELLAETWTRHQSPDFIEASILDAAVVFAAFTRGRRMIADMPILAGILLVAGPTQVSSRLVRQANHQLERTFDEWWDDDDFLMVADLLDLPPRHAEDLKALLGIPDEVLRPMFEVLGRWRVSEDLAAHLTGLLTAVEIEEALPLLALGKARLA